MRKIFTILMALILLCAPAYAFDGENYPAWDGASLPANAACGVFSGQKLQLEFDPAPDFSMVENGVAQICFFAQDEDMSHYLELYLLLPMDVQAGDVISEKTPLPQGCSVTLYEVAPDRETLYYAGQVYGLPYPDGASFALQINSAETTESAFSLSGSLSAALGRLEENLATGETLTLESITFDFSLPLGDTARTDPFDGSLFDGSLFDGSLFDGSLFDGSLFDGNPFETNPGAAAEAAPKFTLPPDYIRL